jgi:hypothetical protein
MSVHKNITRTKFPQQEHIGVEVAVTFHYDTKNPMRGHIVRSDVNSPFITIIKLVDGRYILSDECHYSIVQDDYFAKTDAFTYKNSRIVISLETKHLIIGEVVAEEYADADYFPVVKTLIKKGEVVTEEIFNKLLKQGRKEIEINKLIKKVK